MTSQSKSQSGFQTGNDRLPVPVLTRRRGVRLQSERPQRKRHRRGKQSCIFDAPSVNGRRNFRVCRSAHAHPFKDVDDGGESQLETGNLYATFPRHAKLLLLL